MRLPHDTSAECKSGSADVEGRGRFGEIQIEAGSGDVQLQEVGGDAKVSAASGNVAIVRA